MTYPELLARKAAPCNVWVHDRICNKAPDKWLREFEGVGRSASDCSQCAKRPAIEAAVREAIERCIGVTHAMVFAEPWLVVDALRSLLTEEVPDDR